MGTYRERLLVPASYWLLLVPVAVLLGAETYFFVDGFLPILVICLIGAVMAVFLVHWSNAVIEVAGGTLRAGKDTLPLAEIGPVTALDQRQSAAMRGPRADPAAFLLLRPYLSRAVYVELAARDGAVPYWLLATRRPEELAAAIENARATGGPQPGQRQSVGG